MICMGNTVVLVGERTVWPHICKELLVKALGATRDGDIGENKWRLPLETRYYTATLCISITECLSVDDANLNSLSESPEALVFVNPSQETKDLLSKLDDMPPITLVLHNGDDSTTTNQWKEFCLEREIECILVKNANATDEEDSETTGWARVKEALECHMWPDLKLLRESDKTQLYDVSTDPSLTLPQMDKVEAMRERLFGHSKHDAEELNSFGLDDEDDGLERAFETMSSLKNKAATLSWEDRHELAAQVALSFGLEMDRRNTS